jgi:hypothetical protein
MSKELRYHGRTNSELRAEHEKAVNEWVATFDLPPANLFVSDGGYWVTSRIASGFAWFESEIQKDGSILHKRMPDFKTATDVERHTARLPEILQEEVRLFREYMQRLPDPAPAKDQVKMAEELHEVMASMQRLWKL